MKPSLHRSIGKQFNLTLMQLSLFQCEYCGAVIVVIPTLNNSVLPVEVIEGNTYSDEDVFDSNIHTSHLKKCKALADAWHEKKLMHIKRINPFSQLNVKELCR